MFDYFEFSLPRAVTEHLVEHLNTLKPSPLNADELTKLSNFQRQHKTHQGVYVVYQGDVAVYAGKSDHLADRLGDHLWKLRGRQNIDLTQIGFKATLLHENWSTSANEDLLIKHFKLQGQCQWNGKGLGPNDPGKNRDGSKPNWFDLTYPVREDFPIEGVADETTISTVLAEIKKQVPYLFRYSVSKNVAAAKINLRGIPRTTRELLIFTGRALGDGWQLMLFKNGLTLYNNSQSYEHGTQLLIK